MIGFIYDRKDKCTQFDDEVMGTKCGINGRNEEVERFWVWCGVVWSGLIITTTCCWSADCSADCEAWSCSRCCWVHCDSRPAVEKRCLFYQLLGLNIVGWYDFVCSVVGCWALKRMLESHWTMIEPLSHWTHILCSLPFSFNFANKSRVLRCSKCLIFARSALKGGCV